MCCTSNTLSFLTFHVGFHFLSFFKSLQRGVARKWTSIKKWLPHMKRPSVKCWPSMRQHCSCAEPNGEPFGASSSPALMRDSPPFPRSQQAHSRRSVHSFPQPTSQLHNGLTKGRVQRGRPPPAPFKETCTASLSSPGGFLHQPNVPPPQKKKTRSKMTMKLAYWDIRGVSLFAKRRQPKVKISCRHVWSINL